MEIHQREAVLDALTSSSVVPADLASAEENPLALYRALQSYLPALLVHEVLQTPAPPTVRHTFYHGSVLFVDISGFSTISRALSTQGKAGAEEMTEILNRCFAELLNVACSCGGQRIKSCGDALLLYFQGDEHLERSALSALHMQDSMQQFATIQTSRGDYALTLHAGINTGSFYAASVGSVECRHDYIFSGPAVTGAIKAQDMASSGEVFLAPSAAALLASRAQLGASCDGYRALVDLLFDHALEKRFAGPPPSMPTLEQVSTLSSYLPASLLKRLALQPGEAERPGEHRQVTTMFINFSDLDELLLRDDPNDPCVLLRELERYYSMIDRTVSHYGGIIARCDPMGQGDKLLILFGAPVSHENDAEHAIRCALDLNAGLVDLQSAIRHRIGIAAGHVFCGDVGPSQHREYTVIGDTTNLAARLMTAAGDAEILVSAPVINDLEDRLEVELLPDIRAKGFAQPVRAYRVTGWRATHTRLRGSGIHRLIDRQSELDQLQTVINRACSSQGQAICITGPAGIGKSALSRAAIKSWQGRGGDVYIGSCEAYGERIPYLPWVEILENLLGLLPTDTVNTRRQKIARCASELIPEWQDRLSPLIALLGVPAVEASHVSRLDPRLYRQHLHEIVTSLLCASAQRQPLMVTISDLHWSDRASLDLIQHVTYNIKQYPILLLLSCRLGTDAHRLEAIFDRDFVLEVKELSREDSHAMARALLDDAKVSEELVEQIWAISRGNPLYLREALRYLQEQGYLGRVGTNHYTLNCDPGSIPIPGSIERVIVTALDRLDEPSRQVIKIAAVIGRLFRFRTLSALCSHSPGWLQAALDTLIGQQMICLEDDHQELSYAFCAPQVQEVTYETLAFAQRRRLHRELAHFLERETVIRPERYALLAHHYDLGQAFPQAFEYHGKAGDQARKTYANHEALHHYRRALELLPELTSPPKPRVVSMLQRDLGRVCRFLGQYDEAQESYMQGLALARQHDDLQAEAENLVWMSDLCYVQGDSEGVLVNARRAASMAEQTGDAELLELSLEYIGGGLMLEGALDKALECFTWCLDLSQALGNPQGLRRSLNNIGLIHVSKRQFGPAIAAFGEALQLARDLRDDFYVTVLANNLGELYQELGDTATALPLHEEALSKARRLGVRDFECDCLRNLGVDQARQGQVRQGLDCLKRALSLAQEAGLTVGEAAVLFSLGEIYLTDGRSSEAFAAARDLTVLADRLGLTVIQQRAHLLLGLAHCALGEWTLAQTALESAAALWEREPIGLVGWQSYHALREVYSQVGQMNQAQSMLDLARQIEAAVVDSIEDEDLQRIFLESIPTWVASQ